MKTDTIFYRLFQSFPSIFFELIQLSVTQADNYRFDSVEVKQLAFRIDGVNRDAEGKRKKAKGKNKVSYTDLM